MTLIEDIQRDAVDSSSDLGALLRKCKLLAARLRSRPLEDWLLWESNGYPDEVEVPEYRIWPLELKGHFSGPFGSGLRNAPIPMMCVPEKARHPFMRYQCRQSIASVEEILRKSDDGTLRVSTGDLAVVLGTKVYRDQNCMQAWAEMSTGCLVELLNTVRTRVLDFVLAVWKEAPMAGEPNDRQNPGIEPSKVTQIFNTTVYGGSANLVGSATQSAVTFNVQPHDFQSLADALRTHGLHEDEILELQAAVESDEEVTKPGQFGESVSGWIAKMMQKAANGSWTVGLGAAGNLLAQLISQYYGL